MTHAYLNHDSFKGLAHSDAAQFNYEVAQFKSWPFWFNLQWKIANELLVQSLDAHNNLAMQATGKTEN